MPLVLGIAIIEVQPCYAHTPPVNDRRNPDRGPR